MGTILVNALPAIAFSKNRIFATFQTDSVYASMGVAAVNEFELSGVLFLNRSIVIKYGNVSVEFRTTNPLLPITGTNLPTGSGNLAHAQAMQAYFQANFYLNRDFTISVPNDSARPRVVFTGKTVDSSLNFVPAIYTNITVLNVTKGTVAEKKKNMALAVECQVLRLGTTDTFDTIYSERIPYRGTQIKLNIAELLHAELQPDFPSAWNTVAPWKHTKSLRKYRLRAAEGYGDAFVLQPQETFPEVYVQYGGTGFRQGHGKTVAEWVRGATAADDRFLRNGLSIRYLQTDEPQWLNFINTRSNIASLVIQVRIEYADSSIVTITKTPGIALETAECVSIPVWITAMDLQGVDTEKAIRSYYVRLKSGSSFVSEEVRFVMDYANREHKQYFVFLNSVGGWDSFLAYGKGAYGVAWSNQQVQRPVPASYTLNDADLSDVGSIMRDTFTVATSFYTAEQLRFFRDFFASPYKFRWINGQCLPITIKGRDLAEGSDGQNQYQHEFDYQYAFQNESYE